MSSRPYPNMYTPSQSPMLNNEGTEIDGTINPANLNPVGAFASQLSAGSSSNLLHPYSSPPATATSSDFDADSNKRVAVLSNSSPRGIKRSRSPESYKDGVVTEDYAPGALQETAKRKRGRPPKNKVPGVPASPNLSNTPQQPQQQQQQQHQQQHQQPPPQPLGTPKLTHAPPPIPPPVVTLPTPPKPAPQKPVVKALPTVRDHTTDQLTAEGDEYIPREFDEEGEKKVLPTGHLCNGREYKCRTFHVPNRGDKLFMLATECARVLGYRDSYLLFNKNRSLYKIIATQTEKDDLIQQELLPYSYRSRQIAIVTARSMFRQFGSRVIVEGRRVRDDYWEMKARKQGFTEEDPAGEKRPGAAKQRAAASEQAAQQQREQAAAQQRAQHHEPLYTHDPSQLDHQPQPQMVQPGLGGPASVNLAPPLPMIHLTPQEEKSKEFDSVPRPKQEIRGPPYRDQIPPTPPQVLMENAQQISKLGPQFNRASEERGQFIKAHFYTQPQPVQSGQSIATTQPQGSGPSLHHPSQRTSLPQHPLHAPSQLPHIPMSPQQMSLRRQNPSMPPPQQSPRPNEGVQPQHLSIPSGGEYMTQGAMTQGPNLYHQQPPHPPYPQHPQPHHPQSSAQSMPSMHTIHGGQAPPMYPSPASQQQYMPPHNYRQQQSSQPPQWWNGA